jgi:predicted Zn-dependent protease
MRGEKADERGPRAMIIFARRSFWIGGMVWFLLTGCAVPSPNPPAKASPPERPPHGEVTPSKELGRDFLKEALQHYEFVKDPEVTGAVNAVGRRIVAGLGSNPEAFHFLVVHEDEPNAFAIPGGYIFVFDGLLLQIDGFDQLAGVLSHEIAHVERNHFFKDEKKIAALDIATIAAILLGGASAASVMIAGAANMDVRLQFSRENEMEADSYALRYLQKAGYDPWGLADFFKNLVRYERFNPQLVPAYEATHPALESRLQRIEGFLGEKKTAVHPQPEEDWQRITAVLSAQRLGAKEEGGILQMLHMEGVPPELQEERRHALLGLVYLKANRVTQAITEYEAAIRKNPSRPDYHADLALAYLRQQHVSESSAEAEEALRLDPQDAAAHRVMGMIEESTDRIDEAENHLSQAVRIAPDDPLTNLHLALCHGRRGDLLEQAFYTARYFRLNLEPERALREFRRAKGLAKEGSPLLSRVTEEIDEIEREGM